MGKGTYLPKSIYFCTFLYQYDYSHNHTFFYKHTHYSKSLFWNLPFQVRSLIVKYNFALVGKYKHKLLHLRTCHTACHLPAQGVIIPRQWSQRENQGSVQDATAVSSHCSIKSVFLRQNKHQIWVTDKSPPC